MWWRCVEDHISCYKSWTGLDVQDKNDGDFSGLASDSSDESSDELQMEIITEEFLFTAPDII